MEANTLREAASGLVHAYETGKPIPPLVDTYPGVTSEDAYRIQQRVVQCWVERGDAVRGHKVGLSSAAMQRQMGVDQPDYGHLTGGMFHLEHQRIPVESFIQPRIEPEIAFVLGRELGGPG